MVVKDWSEVTMDSLLSYRVPTTSKDVVFLDYWLDRIDNVVEEWRYEYLGTKNAEEPNCKISRYYDIVDPHNL